MAALLTVEPGYEAALAAALGELAEAVAVGSPAEAGAALRRLKAADGGRAGLLIAGEHELPDRSELAGTASRCRPGRWTWSAPRSRCGRRCWPRWTGWRWWPSWPTPSS